MKVAIIVAAARNGVIGRENKLPWHLPGDLKYFKAVTLGKPVIMGRKTHESIGRALPGRLNIVVSRRHAGAESSPVRWVHSLSDAVKLARKEQPDSEEVMIMGGAEIYRQSLPLVDRIYLTRIDADIEGDARFPELDPEQWQLVEEEPGPLDAPIRHSFQRYERVSK